MALFGKILLILGIIMTFSSLIGGFWLLSEDYDDYAELAFMIVPTGMFIGFVGLSTIVMFSPRDNEINDCD